jgi:hypothetical protein
MSKNKSIFGTTTLLIGAGLLGAYLVVKKMNEPKEGMPDGSLGGTDDLLGQQGFDIDPNSVPDNQPVNDYTYYVITPEGQLIPNATPTAGTDSGTGIPSNVPIASTGTGTLFQDASAVGGALGANLLLPSIAKRINKLVDTKYISDAVSKEVKQTPFQKFIKDPYAINDLAVSKAEKTGTREIAELAINIEGKTVLKTVPKWAKGVKTVANFIPLLDIPIGAGLDVYFAKYEEDPTKKIDWWSAIKANTAGELAQLGITGGAAAAGTVVPVAGNIAGGVGGFVVGTSADIAATELYYKQMGKTSLFSGDSTKAQTTNLTAAQVTAQQNLYSQLGINTSANPFASSSSGATYDSSTNTYTSASGAKQSMAATAPQAQAATKVSSSSSSSSSGGSSSLPAIFQPAANPFTSSGSSSSSSSSSNKSTPTNSTSSNVTKSSAAPVSSAKSTPAPATAPKTSVVSNVASAVKSAVSNVASRVSSFFGGGKKK